MLGEVLHGDCQGAPARDHASLALGEDAATRWQLPSSPEPPPCGGHRFVVAVPQGWRGACSPA